MMNNCRVKLCVNPKCDRVNPSNGTECVECGTSLINVKAILSDKIEDEKLRKKAMQDVKVETPEVLMVRICDCGHCNAANSRICEECGEEISDIIPVLQTVASKEYVLESLDKNFCFKVVPNNISIGRECQMQEYLKEKHFVGRKHAETRLDENGLFIMDLNSTNGTFVNNEKIESCKWFLLSEGDEVAFGGKVINGKRQEEAAYFVVRTN